MTDPQSTQPQPTPQPPRPQRSRQTGPQNPNWKGGRSVASNGYVLVKAPNHPRADSRGYVYEHIIVAERKLGRALLPGEEVHHDNERKTDNRPSNLIVKASRREHGAAHRKPGSKVNQGPDEPNTLVICACGCGGTLPRFDRWRRERRFITGHNGRGKGGQYGR